MIIIRVAVLPVIIALRATVICVPILPVISHHGTVLTVTIHPGTTITEATLITATANGATDIPGTVPQATTLPATVPQVTTRRRATLNLPVTAHPEAAQQAALSRETTSRLRPRKQPI